jgi:tRNA (cmo5U34)-methyltransferase
MDNTTPHAAKNYDSQIRKTIPYYDRLHFEILDLVESIQPKCQTWLDTGCGTGHFLELAHDVFSPCRFYASDPSPEMLAVAQSRLAEFTEISFLPPQPTEQLADPGLPPLDIITAIQSHHYLNREGRKQATRVCYRLLAENGVYITFENTRPDTAEGISIGLKRWGRFQKARGQDEATVKQHQQRFDTHYFPITIQEHLTMLKAAGFRTVELFWHSYMQSGFYAIK